mgnify:CR=1 FL=1
MLTDLDSISVNDAKNQTYYCTCNEDNYGVNCEKSGLVQIKTNINDKLSDIITNSGSGQTISDEDAAAIKEIIAQIGEIEELVDEFLTDKIYEFISK